MLLNKILLNNKKLHKTPSSERLFIIFCRGKTGKGVVKKSLFYSDQLVGKSRVAEAIKKQLEAKLLFVPAIVVKTGR